jgi:polar amino acid transport system substrate-binding protein
VTLVVTGCGFTEEDTGTTTSTAPELVDAGALTVCTSFPYPPFEFKKDGKPVGFDIDLANKVAKTLGLRPVIVHRDFDAIVSGQVLNNGSCDVAVAGITILGERARVLDFSIPYFEAAQRMVVREGSGIDSLDDLSGDRIGVQAGTTGELYVTDNAPADAEIVPFPDASDVDAALDSGEVEAGIYDNTVVRDVIRRYPEFEAATEFPTGEEYGMAVKKNSNVNLLRSINEVLSDLQASVEYDEIYSRWFGGSPPNQ